MSSQNLLKSGWFMLNSDEVRVIDSNEMIASKLGKVEEDTSEVESDAKPYVLKSFDSSPEDEAVARLFGEDQNGINIDESGAVSQTEDIISDDGQVIEEEAGDNSESLEKIKERAKQIIAEAQEEAQAIIEQAQVISEQQANQAYEQAKQQGVQDGYQEGFQKAEAESQAVKQEYAQKMQELQNNYDIKMEEMEPNLVEELTGIYEHVFHVELSQYKSVLVHLIANTLHSVENSASYLIHVSNQDFSFVSMQKPQIIEEGCTGNIPVEIIEDMALSKNECLIETENGIFDCSLSVQLTELKRKLQLLSYNGTKE